MRKLIASIAIAAASLTACHGTSGTAVHVGDSGHGQPPASAIAACEAAGGEVIATGPVADPIAWWCETNG